MDKTRNINDFNKKLYISISDSLIRVFILYQVTNGDVDVFSIRMKNFIHKLKLVKWNDMIYEYDTLYKKMTQKEMRKILPQI